MDINEILEKIHSDTEKFCRNYCPYYPCCIYPACEHIEYDGTNYNYKLDPFWVDLLEDTKQ